MPPLNPNLLATVIAASFNQSPEGPPAVTTMMSSVTLRGVTFNFDKPMPVCFSCLGDPAVISTESFQITSITPISDNDSAGFTRNGAMLNPSGASLSNSQGFDGRVGDTSFQPQSTTPYLSSVNIDPNVSGAYNVSVGFSGSIVKSVRDPSIVNTSWRTIIDYVVLTILPSVPLSGFFRPPMAGTDKTIKINWREANVNYNVLRNESAGSNLQISLQDAEYNIKPTSPFFQPAGNGERLRRLNIEDPSLVDGNYSRNFCFTRTDAINLLHSNLYTNSQKRTIFLRVIQHGIDLFGELNNGFTGLGGAGQGYGRQFQPYYAAFALSDLEILSKARDQRGSSVFGQHFWVKSDDVGYPVTYPRNAGQKYSNQLTYLDSDVGIPEWEQSPIVNTSDRSSALDNRYREMWPAGIMEYLNIALLRNGPGNIDGLQAIMNGPDDSSNPRASAPNYYDRISVRTPVAQSHKSFQSNNRSSIFNLRRPLINKPLWVGRPDWVIHDWEKTSLNLNHIWSTNSGEIGYRFPSHSTLPVTGRKIRYSLDAVQYTEIDVNNVANVDSNGNSVGTITGLTPGLTHYLGFSESNALGQGRFSTNTPWAGPLSTDSAPTGNQRPNGVVVAGTSSNSVPNNTILPIMYLTRFALYKGEEYAPAPPTLTNEFMTRGYKKLIAGLGYWTGWPTPVFTINWYRNGNLFLSNSKEYDVDGYVDSNSSLTYQVVATNSQGTTTVSSNTINVPQEVEPSIPNTFPVVQNISDSATTSTTPVYFERLTKLRNINDCLTGTIAIKAAFTMPNIATDFAAVFAMGTNNILANNVTGSDFINITIRPNGVVRLNLFGENGVPIAAVTTGAGRIVSGVEATIIASWDIPNGVIRLSVHNGTNNVVTSGTITNNVAIPLQSTSLTYKTRLLGNSANSVSTSTIRKTKFKYFYLNTQSYVDLSNATEREKFNDSTIMSGWGDGISNTRPVIFMWGTAVEHNNDVSNKGIGGQIFSIKNIYNNSSNVDDELNGTILAEIIDSL